MRVTDPQAIRALTHPLRLDLLELLSASGPATAAHCGRVLGVPQANCSFHLRQLAKYGFVEDAGPGADQRERRWRVPEGGPRIRIPADASPVVSRVLARMVVERETQAILSYLDADDGPQRIAHVMALMSPNEAAELWESWKALLQPYVDRIELDRIELDRIKVDRIEAADREPGQRHYRWFVAATPTDPQPEDDR